MESLNSGQMLFAELMFTHMPVHAQLEQFGTLISALPDFRSELDTADAWPVGVHRSAAKAYLEESSQMKKWLPYSVEFALASPAFEPSEMMLHQRLHVIHPAVAKWYTGKLHAGSVSPETPGDCCTYARTLRHNHSNLQYRQERVRAGRAHVAVGFVDLSFLMNAVIEGEGQLRFVGYDRCPFAVAKTLVVWRMLRMSAEAGDEERLVRSVLQVWYSSTWEESTLKDFKQALCELMNETVPRPEDEVRQLHSHWANSSAMSVSKARAGWMELHDSNCSRIGNLARLCDRIDLARYEFTGDFGLVSSPHCASVTMFDCPRGTLPSERNATVFAAVELSEVFKRGGSLTEATRGHLIDGIKRLRALARSGAVTVELHCEAVEDATDEIASLKPWSMSWSNLLDYFNTQMFHRIARACSCDGDTVHYGYSMNWHSRVFGTSLVDMSNVPGEHRVAIMKNARSRSAVEHELLFRGRFRDPVPENPLNATDRSLAMTLRTNWTDYYFGVARKAGPCQLAAVHPSLPNPLSHTSCCSLFFVWTYDPQNELPPISSPKAPSVQEPKSCASCSSRVHLSACGRCWSLWYCGKVCQRADWPRHKPECRRPK